MDDIEYVNNLPDIIKYRIGWWNPYNDPIIDKCAKYIDANKACDKIKLLKAYLYKNNGCKNYKSLIDYNTLYTFFIGNSKDPLTYLEIFIKNKYIELNRIIESTYKKNITLLQDYATKNDDPNFLNQWIPSYSLQYVLENNITNCNEIKHKITEKYIEECILKNINEKFIIDIIKKNKFKMRYFSVNVVKIILKKYLTYFYEDKMFADFIMELVSYTDDLTIFLKQVKMIDLEVLITYSYHFKFTREIYEIIKPFLPMYNENPKIFNLAIQFDLYIIYQHYIEQGNIPNQDHMNLLISNNTNIKNDILNSMYVLYKLEIKDEAVKKLMKHGVDKCLYTINKLVNDYDYKPNITICAIAYMQTTNSSNIPFLKNINYTEEFFFHVYMVKGIRKQAYIKKICNTKWDIDPTIIKHRINCLKSKTKPILFEYIDKHKNELDRYCIGCCTLYPHNNDNIYKIGKEIMFLPYGPYYTILNKVAKENNIFIDYKYMMEIPFKTVS